MTTTTTTIPGRAATHAPETEPAATSVQQSRDHTTDHRKGGEGSMRNRVKALREARFWSRAYLAQRAGISRWTLILLEEQRTEQPSARVMRKLARALGATPPHGLWVLDGDGGDYAVISRLKDLDDDPTRNGDSDGIDDDDQDDLDDAAEVDAATTRFAAVTAGVDDEARGMFAMLGTRTDPTGILIATRRILAWMQATDPSIQITAAELRAYAATWLAAVHPTDLPGALIHLEHAIRTIQQEVA